MEKAITAGNNIITTRLVDVGANPGQRGKDGLTLLSRAVLFGGEKLITELDVTPSFTNSVMSFSPGKMEDAKSFEQESAKTSWAIIHQLLAVNANLAAGDDHFCASLWRAFSP
ncbi:hypothetical protein WJX82_010436 [Trebouxia sp. C0006]